MCEAALRKIFVQTHKSYIVALQAIWKIEGNEIVLQDICPRIPLSREENERGETGLSYICQQTLNLCIGGIMVGVNIMRYTIELCKVGIVEAGILRVEQRKRDFSFI